MNPDNLTLADVEELRAFIDDPERTQAVVIVSADKGGSVRIERDTIQRELPNVAVYMLRTPEVVAQSRGILGWRYEAFGGAVRCISTPDSMQFLIRPRDVTLGKVAFHASRAQEDVDARTERRRLRQDENAVFEVPIRDHSVIAAKRAKPGPTQNVKTAPAAESAPQPLPEDQPNTLPEPLPPTAPSAQPSGTSLPVGAEPATQEQDAAHTQLLDIVTELAHNVATLTHNVAAIEQALADIKGTITASARSAAPAPSTPSATDPQPIDFDDPEEELRYLVHDTYLRKYSASDRASKPLRDYTIGPEFIDAMTDPKYDIASQDQILNTIVDVLTGHAFRSKSRQAHTHNGIGPSKGQSGLVRADGATAYRCAINASTGARLLWWEVPAATPVELALVARHDESRIP